MKKPKRPSKSSQGKSVPISMKLGGYTIDFAFNRPDGRPDAAKPADHPVRDSESPKKDDGSFDSSQVHE